MNRSEPRAVENACLHPLSPAPKSCGLQQRMTITFEPMTEAYAREITSWCYPPPYDVYGHSESERDQVIAFLTNDVNKAFAVICAGGIIGFRTFGPDGQVPGGFYEAGYLDTGGGLRPDLTGKGWGEEIMRQGLAIGSRLFAVERFRITVAAFNQRALKVCQRIGFKEIQRFKRKGDHEQFIVLVLDDPKGKPIR